MAYNKAFQHDIGSLLAVEEALNPQTIGTTADASEKTGTIIDRQSPNNLRFSCKAALSYYASLAAGNTVTLKMNLQHSDTTASSDFADYDDKDGSTANSVTAGTTGSTAAQTPSGVLTADFDLGMAKRYIRLQATPTLSGGSTESDDVDIAGVVIFGGGEVLPPA